VRVVIDAKEQRIQRPQADTDEHGQGHPSESGPSEGPGGARGCLDRQKPYYSGKKKTHTLKTQLAVRPDGVIEALSESVPGSTHDHDLTLLRQTELMTQLDEDQAAMLDKGYDGLQNSFALTQLVQPYKARRPDGPTQSSPQRGTKSVQPDC
jgi:DDE superfamily endonuclease